MTRPYWIIIALCILSFIAALVFTPPFRLSGSFNVNVKWVIVYADPLITPTPTPTMPDATSAKWMPSLPVPAFRQAGVGAVP